MAHKPVGSGVSFAVATASATSGIMTHFTDTVRVHVVGGDAHVAVGIDPTAANSDYFVPSGTTVTLSVGRPKSQKVVGVTTGTTTTIDSVTVESKDRNIELGSVASGTFTGNVAFGQTTITSCSDTSNLAPGVAVAIQSGSGTITLPAGALVQSVSGTTVTINQAFQGSGSANGVTFTAGGPTNSTADGGGLTILGGSDGDKSFTWGTANAGTFNSSEHINLANGHAIYINGTEVLSATQVLGVPFGGGGSGAAVTTDGTQTLSNKTLQGAILTGTLTASSALMFRQYDQAYQ